MASKLDKSLDDIVKSNKKFGRGGRGGTRGGVRGGARGGIRGGARGGGRGGIKRLNSTSPMKRGSFGAKPFGKMNGAPTPSGPFRLVVSNLDFGVNDQDINELFQRCGNFSKACVHYDANGRSQGTAEVVYRSYKEAQSAVNEYNGRLLDGRAMNVQIAGAPVKSPSMASRVGGKPGRGGAGNKPGQRRSIGQANGSPRRGVNRGGRGGRGRGGRGGKAPVSKEDLDKQMEEYKMQTDTA